MTNTYRAITDTGAAIYEPGVFERDFTPDEEKDWLASGHIELVPRPYVVKSSNFAAGAPGEVCELALLKETEAALIEGGHLERADPKPESKPKSKPKANEAGEH